MIAMRRSGAVVALAAVGLLAGGAVVPATATAATTSAPAADAGALHDCSGAAVTVDGRGRILTYELDGTKRGVAAKLEGVDGRLGYQPKAFTWAGESGDVANGTRIHFAVSPAGRLQLVTVNTDREGGYRTTMTAKTIGRGFSPVAIAASADLVDEAPGTLYTADRKGMLRKYTYSEARGLSKGVIVARGLGRVGDLEIRRTVDAKDPRGGYRSTADVLMATDTRTGALREITVPYVMKRGAGRVTVSVLAKSGFGSYRNVVPMTCSGKNSGAVVGFDGRGRGTVYLDRNVGDGRTGDLKRVGTVIGTVSGH